MTGQIPDTLRFVEVEYSIAGIRKDRTHDDEIIDGSLNPSSRRGLWAELFDPADSGLETKRLISACSRGYICHYGITDNHLYLESLEAFVPEKPADFLGIRPSEKLKVAEDIEDVWHAYYSYGGGYLVVFNDIHHQIHFTGELLVGRGFIHELYIHRSFQAAYRFREVMHFVFLRGRLIGQKDRSQEAASVRDHRARGGKLDYPQDFRELGFDPWAT